MKQNLYVQTDGLSDIIDELNSLVDDVDDVVIQAANAYGEEAMRDVQKSYLSIRSDSEGRKPQQGDFLYSSIGYRMIKSTDPESVAWGGIGVYDIADVRAKFGKTDKDLTAAQIAYWTEFGTTRFTSGARKPKDVDWSDVKGIATTTTSPQPFVSNAMINGETRAEDAFVQKFNEVMK